MEHLGEKVVMSSAAADLNKPAQQLWTEQQNSQFSTWAPIRKRLSPQTAPWPSYVQRYKGELRLTSGRYPSGMKIIEETGSNPYCPAATAGDHQASRVWSGPPEVLQQRSLTVRRKTKKHKEITSSSTKRMSTQRPHLKVASYKDDR